MKNIAESGEVMAAYAEIDYGYLMLRLLLDTKHPAPRNTLDLMIDRITGYDDFTFKQKKRDSILWLKHIIKNKKLIEADYSYDEKVLNDIKKLK